MQQITTPEKEKKKRTNASGRVSQTYFVLPEVLLTFSHRALDLDLNNSEAIEEAMRLFCAPPRVVSRSLLTTEEQVLIDGVLDMYRNPRRSDAAMIRWLLEHVSNR